MSVPRSRERNPAAQTASYNDEQIAALMERAMAQVQGPPGRFGDRKVFIAALWPRMQEMDGPGGLTEGVTLDDFKGWLWRNLATVYEDGRPLYRLARADLVSAMDPDMVADSQIDVDHVQYHFVVDPAIERAKRSRYAENPAWATAAVADAWETMTDQIPNRWFPKMTRVRGIGAEAIAATIKEYGCGAYGCAFPTSDPQVVMKLTTDATEAEFAANFANDLVRPICVRYFAVIRLAVKHQGRQIYLLWRESAEHVGNIGKVVGPDAAEDIDHQHLAGQQAFKTLRKHPGTPQSQAAIDNWIAACNFMASTKELHDMGAGMIEIWKRQHIIFGDVHSGNVGLVAREDGGHWVITDPGNIAVVGD